MLTNKIFEQSALKFNFLKRCKHKATHWSVVQKKKSSCDKALEHFDEFYSNTFGKNWPSIRRGLLGKQKYIAVLNNFSDSDQVKTILENKGALNLRTLFNLEKQYMNDSSSKRNKCLEKIWRMDKDMDEKISKAEKEETNEIKENIYHSQSLEKNLLNAKIDFTRIISSDTSSALNLYEFMPATKLKGKDDWIPEPTHNNEYSHSEFSVATSKEYDIPFPEQLNAYCYEIGNNDDFPAPKSGTTGVLDYYLMDGGSLLPVLALDIKPGDKVLDMCAAPGGKSFLALQTLYPDSMICNDVTISRTNRIYNVMRQYLYDFDEKWLSKRKIRITLSDGRHISEEDFDKIIVDVPCTADRHSVKVPENNIFKPSRIKERLKLPEFQCELLVQALKLVCVGGIVVYSTCSLSPIQNDGVVHMALKRLCEETNVEVSIRNMSAALVQTASVYKLADQKILKYGHLVVPDVQLNFGPTYFCKLQRVK